MFNWQKMCAVCVLHVVLCAMPAVADTLVCMPTDVDGALNKASERSVRFATFNAYLNRFQEGDLISDLQSQDNSQIRAVAEIIQRTHPDVLLLNEFDYDESGTAIALFQTNYLSVPQNGQAAIEYPYIYLAESNTGLASGYDLDNDGVVNGAGDAFGFGSFPGQYGMVLLSKFPIIDRQVRTFQKFLWKDMPGALLPDDAQTSEVQDYYNDEELKVFRLSSKSHWDIPLWINGAVVHVLAAHPTPPVFDGIEDRNGRRNHDEIRFWADYVSGSWQSKYIYDDQGRRGGIKGSKAFVILGDYNADPIDGDSTNNAIMQLLSHPRIDTQMTPASLGADEDAELEGQYNDLHIASPLMDTGDFNPANPGNLRVDYVLPSKRGLKPVCGGVFWPREKDQTRYLVGSGYPVVSSDHHLVWFDIEPKGYWYQ
ncbi:endonuclease/exonuclease/phosphatase family protein [Teredinibacter sp. KSP-S5-2]|uniref:endonuclease/exonuclease/phosphatase family protein n=1 Tax=Teredinibacter sp. KSP-S5-2 TaxID=3034506 RepID=UPI0029348892|nr:endonuclease/exonuclease/phosphatase family protein [Teredinibacter sp. KSP-S5-2]WNO07582.1 endonuclease/exonuclease/phosphatase family protein [Teredinibacter sp. KSP-S5-2]